MHRTIVACSSDSGGPVLPPRGRRRRLPGEVHWKLLGIPRRCSVSGQTRATAYDNKRQPGRPQRRPLFIYDLKSGISAPQGEADGWPQDRARSAPGRIVTCSRRCRKICSAVRQVPFVNLLPVSLTLFYTDAGCIPVMQRGPTLRGFRPYPAFLRDFLAGCSSLSDAAGACVPFGTTLSSAFFSAFGADCF